MNRFFAVACLAVQLTLWPGYGGHARPVFFSLLFPQLMPRQRETIPEDWANNLFEGAGEAMPL